jgi:hypothetical protein
MSARMVWLSTSFLLAGFAPVSAQIGERAREAQRRPSVDIRVTIPGRPDIRDRDGRDRNDNRDRDWRNECRYESRRGDRDRNHDWYDRDGRWDCGDTYRADRYPTRYADRGLVRAHSELLLRLDREHERWHRTHGWSPRNRGWERSHLALHERLEREHERWHRQLNAPYEFWFDRPGFDTRPGHASGVAHR